MQVLLAGQPAYSIATVVLGYGESVMVDPGGMAMMSDGIDVKARAQGGVVRSVMRKQLGDESFFMSRYTAQAEGAWVRVAPPYPGDIAVIQVEPDAGLFAESGSVLAHSTDVTVDVRYAGLRNIVMREGATVLRLTGSGTALLSSYGAVEEHRVGPGQSIVVDTGHLVAWDGTVGYEVGMLGGAVTSALTGEGLVARMSGGRAGGRVWTQSRAEQELKRWLLPERAQNDGAR